MTHWRSKNTLCKTSKKYQKLHRKEVSGPALCLEEAQAPRERALMTNIGYIVVQQHPDIQDMT